MKNLSLGTTPKDRLSNLAAIAIVVGGAISFAASNGLLSEKAGSWGAVLAFLGASATARLTGRDPVDISKSQRSGASSNL